MTPNKKILFIKPPDRYLENEFVYQQLGPHYLQSYLNQFGISSDLLILYEPDHIRRKRQQGEINQISSSHLNMILIGEEKICDTEFDQSIFENYDIIGMSVMTPQAPDAYLLNRIINKHYSHVTTVIGGAHARYYQDSVSMLPEYTAFDFIVPHDGWKPIYQIVSGNIKKNEKSRVLVDNFHKLTEIPPPTRPLPLMERYKFNIAGVEAFHTITALGCPFTCNFCESGQEKVRRFSKEMINEDLRLISETHTALQNDKKAVMFFDDVGLMTPKQVEGLSATIKRYQYTTWRAFTHASLVVRYNNNLLLPFKESGGKRIGLGLESGSQRSLDLINKCNGKKQYIKDHYEAVKIANNLGIAVDAFTMIYPWENEKDLRDTTRMIESIIENPVNGYDEKGRQMKNHVDSTIMTPFQGTEFNRMINAGEMPGVEIDKNFNLGNLFFKGNRGKSGWPYLKTRLTKERYEEEQAYRNSLRPKYR